MSEDHEETWRDFQNVVNMTATELKRWLDTDEAQDVGQKKAAANPPVTRAVGVSSRSWRRRRPS